MHCVDVVEGLALDLVLDKVALDYSRGSIVGARLESSSAALPRGWDGVGVGVGIG